MRRIKDLDKILNEYIDLEKGAAWAPSTRRNARAQLSSMLDLLVLTPPQAFAAISAEKRKSSVRVYMVLLIQFIDYLIEKGHAKGPNRMRAWYNKNLKFRDNQIKPKIPKISFEEAVEKISNIKNEMFRKKALQVLYGGMRYTESMTFDKDTCYIIGKRTKHRRVYLPPELRDLEFDKLAGAHMSSALYVAFYRALKDVGLKPHDLRKICATRLSKELTPYQLMERMGWSNLNTAQYYVNAGNYDEVTEKIKNVLPKLTKEMLE